MTGRYTLGDCRGRNPAYCGIYDSESHKPWPIYTASGDTQQQAQSEAQRLVDRLNDPGEPVYVTITGYDPAPAKPFRVLQGGRR